MAKHERSIEAERIHRLASLVIGAILFIAVVAYAGARGHFAYVHKPSFDQTFQPQGTVNFPAITLCPLWNVPIQPIQCIKETSLVKVADCLSTVHSRQITLEGITLTCITFNEASPILYSNSLSDELAIRVFINSSLIPPDEGKGALVMLHAPGVDPALEVDSSFVAAAGELTEVWIRKVTITSTTGATEDDYLSTASAADYVPTGPQDFNDVLDIDFAYTEQGVYFQQQYYAYTPNNWIGEVGGFACLMLFLHKAVCYVIGAIAQKVHPGNPSVRLNNNDL